MPRPSFGAAIARNHVEADAEAELAAPVRDELAHVLKGSRTASRGLPPGEVDVGLAGGDLLGDR